MLNREQTEQRLSALEIKASFTEDLVDRLNDVIVRQQRQIDRLQREVDELLQPAPEGRPRAFAACVTNCRRTTDARLLMSASDAGH